MTISDVAGFISVPEADRALNWGARNLMVEIDNLSQVVPPKDTEFVKTLNSPSNVGELNHVPIHVISSTFSFCQVYPDLLCNDLSHTDNVLVSALPKQVLAPIILYNLFVTVSNDLPNGIDNFVEHIYNGETSDVIVPLSSMQAGLGGTRFNSHFTGITHSNSVPGISGVTEVPEVHDRLKDLLTSDVHDESNNGSFTKNGIVPSPLTYNVLPNFTGNIVGRNSNLALTSKILINRDPVIFDGAEEGDALSFNIYAEDVDKIIVTYENENNNDSFSYEIRENVLFENAFSFTVQNGYSGNTTITALGYKDGVLGFAKSTVNLNIGVNANVTLQSIHFEDENPVVSNQDSYHYNVIGSFSDGIDRIINDFDGLTYAIEDTSILSQIDNSAVKAEAVGSTLLTATINGLEDTVLVTVQENPSLLQTILTGFYGVPDTGNTSVDVHWETLREYENATFVLETSYNTPDNFVEINQQPGNGTTAEPAQFNFSDTSFGSNTLIYYRLKMVDTSNNITYSSTIEIDLSALSVDDNALNDFDLKLYPNPVSTGNVTLALNSNLSDQDAKLELYNLQGKRLSLQALNVVQGSNNFNLKLSQELSNGIYLVRISTAGYIKTLKLVVNK